MITEDKLIDSIKIDLTNKGYGVITDWEFKHLVPAAKQEYLDSMDRCSIQAPRKGFHYSDLETSPHRKLAIGSKNGNKDPYPQLLQTTYFSQRHKDYQNLAKIFSYLVSLRNLVLDMPEDFGNAPERDGWWNACRIHHYPAGGGFMVSHRDTHFPSLLEKSGFPFLQIMVLLSNRGEDFETGGGFVVSRQGETVFYETENCLGNIVFFDGSIFHGVEDVDSHKVMDFNSKLGRMAGFVGHYKVL